MNEISKRASDLISEFGIKSLDCNDKSTTQDDRERDKAWEGLINYVATLEAENAALKAELKNARELIGMTPSAPEVDENEKLKARIAELEAAYEGLQYSVREMAVSFTKQQSRIAELEAAQRWIPVSERLPDGGHREFYEVACMYQDFGELALFSKGRWFIYEGENVYDVTKRVKFWRKRQYLPDEVIAILSKGEMNPEVQE